MEVRFALGLHDEDGDVYDDGIFLFVGDVRTILKFDSLAELMEFTEKLNTAVIPEITWQGLSVPEKSLDKSK